MLGVSRTTLSFLSFLVNHAMIEIAISIESCGLGCLPHPPQDSSHSSGSLEDGFGTPCRHQTLDAEVLFIIPNIMCLLWKELLHHIV